MQSEIFTAGFSAQDVDALSDKIDNFLAEQGIDRKHLINIDFQATDATYSALVVFQREK